MLKTAFLLNFWFFSFRTEQGPLASVDRPPQAGYLSTGESQTISHSQPDLGPLRKRPPFLAKHNKSLSSGQLMAIAAKYATVAGDRVHHLNLPRPLAGRDPAHRSLTDVGYAGESLILRGDPPSEMDEYRTSGARDFDVAGDADVSSAPGSNNVGENTTLL